MYRTSHTGIIGGEEGRGGERRVKNFVFSNLLIFHSFFLILFGALFLVMYKVSMTPILRVLEVCMNSIEF